MLLVTSRIHWRPKISSNYNKLPFDLFWICSQKLYPLQTLAGHWTEIDDHHPILLWINQINQCCHQLRPSLCREIAAKDGIVNRIAKALHGSMDSEKPLLITNIIAHNITDQLIQGMITS